TKQLLIQEAQRLNVDKEHSFRTALKNYYEQSLIKVLSERQYEIIKVEVSDTEVENFINCYGKTFTFIIAKATPGIDIKTVRSRGLQQSLLFDELGASLKFILADLKPGEIAISFLTGNEQHAILLEKIEGKSVPAQYMNLEKIRSRLANFKKEQVFNQWINGLRQKATITINE
ncbi:MAG: hypothetical protein GY705_28440, partial [Bacteroidetes bacterium]|nr:hypothetical protein [Bacteroidota bacterium]